MRRPTPCDLAHLDLVRVDPAEGPPSPPPARPGRGQVVVFWRGGTPLGHLVVEAGAAGTPDAFGRAAEEATRAAVVHSGPGAGSDAGPDAGSDAGPAPGGPTVGERCRGTERNTRRIPRWHDGTGDGRSSRGRTWSPRSGCCASRSSSGCCSAGTIGPLGSRSPSAGSTISRIMDGRRPAGIVDRGNRHHVPRRAAPDADHRAHRELGRAAHRRSV